MFYRREVLQKRNELSFIDKQKKKKEKKKKRNKTNKQYKKYRF